MKTTLAAIIVGLGLFGGMASAQAVTIELYTGSGRPGDQPWLAFTNQFGASETLVSNNGNKVNLNTTANNSIYAGYSNYYSSVNPSTGTPILIPKNPAFPTLDRTGYTLNFSVQVNSESHNGTNGPNRAGFSVTAISDDKKGIELGFWNNEIWAQNTNFTKGESNTFNTQSLNTYSLTISGDTYTLSANGTRLPNLTNQPLRDYASTSPNNPQYLPYKTSNFISLGDNTTSAQANITLGAVSVATPVPFEFSPTLGLLILGSWAVVYQLKNQKSQL